MKELHLFIVWEKASQEKAKIIDDLNKKFKIVDVLQVTWSSKNFSRNISRFYGQKLPKNSFKERHCGTGPFTLIILEDENPNYEERTTSKGSFIVNTSTFDSKELYRSWTGGGHKIHATNDVIETKHDLALLLGKKAENYFSSNHSSWDGNIRNYNEDLVGANEWSSIDELFYVLNQSIEYLVLRNFECLPDKYLLENHGDIDILVKDIKETCFITNAKKISKQKRRVNYSIKIRDENIPFDIRFVGDGYYDSAWQVNMLATRTIYNGFYRPDDENYLYSLLYHALVHKQQISPDYEIRIKNLAQIEKSNSHISKFSLLDFMKKNNYSFSWPTDYSVFINKKVYSGIKKFDPLRSMYFSRVYLAQLIKSIKTKK